MTAVVHPKARQTLLILALVFTLHLACVLGRPANQGGNSSTLHSHRKTYNHGLKTFAKFGDSSAHDARSVHFPPPLDNIMDLSEVSLNEYNYNSHPVDVYDTSQVDDSGGHYVSIDGNTLVDAYDVIRTIRDDVYYDVNEEDVDEEDSTPRSTQPLIDANEVPSPIDEFSRMSPSNRNLKRRQRSSPNSRHHRRRHRLLSKTRDKGHSTDPGASKRRDRFLLKSDGPGHVIFKADEVKKDWCRTIPFEQNVTSGKCSKIVRNNLCYGQCNSFFIPQTGRSSSKVAFQSCSFCKPHRLKWVNVTLGCPGRHHAKVQKTIMRVESCRCIAVDKNEVDRNFEYLRKGTKERNLRASQ